MKLVMQNAVEIFFFKEACILKSLYNFSFNADSVKIADNF